MGWNLSRPRFLRYHLTSVNNNNHNNNNSNSTRVVIMINSSCLLSLPCAPTEPNNGTYANTEHTSSHTPQVVLQGRRYSIANLQVGKRRHVDITQCPRGHTWQDVSCGFKPRQTESRARILTALPASTGGRGHAHADIHIEGLLVLRTLPSVCV